MKYMNIINLLCLTVFNILTINTVSIKYLLSSKLKGIFSSWRFFPWLSVKEMASQCNVVATSTHTLRAADFSVVLTVTRLPS